jgi:uncharacterized membrane protein YgdD (TMEM256/DUF423 family)
MCVLVYAFVLIPFNVFTTCVFLHHVVRNVTSLHCNTDPGIRIQPFELRSLVKYQYAHAIALFSTNAVMAKTCPSVSLNDESEKEIFNDDGHDHSHEGDMSNENTEDFRLLFQKVNEAVIVDSGQCTHTVTPVKSYLADVVYKGGNWCHVGAQVYSGITVYFDACNDPDMVFILSYAGVIKFTNVRFMLINGARSENIFILAKGALHFSSPTKMRGVFMIEGAVHFAGTLVSFAL